MNWKTLKVGHPKLKKERLVYGELVAEVELEATTGIHAPFRVDMMVWYSSRDFQYGKFYGQIREDWAEVVFEGTKKELEGILKDFQENLRLTEVIWETFLDKIYKFEDQELGDWAKQV